MNTVLGAYNNFRVGVKLAIGFGLILLMAAIIMLSGINGFRNIEAYSKKSIISNNVNNYLEEARRERLRFQYTHDYAAINKNGELINKITRELDTAQTLKWDADTRVVLDKIIQTLKEYAATRENLIAASQKRDDAAKKLDNDTITVAIDNLHQQFERATLPADLRLDYLALHERFSTIRNLAHELTLTQSDKTEARLRKMLTDTGTLINQLLPRFANEQQDGLNRVWQQFVTYNGDVTLYTAAYQAEIDAAQRMTSIANTLNQAVDQLYQAQLVKVSNIITQSQYSQLFIGIAIIVAGILMAWRITLQLTRPLHQSLSMAEKIANGDLSASLSVSRKDELG
ncbi:HAMP domain-containing protein, partial [Dickeya sp. DW 0440]